MSKFKIGDKVRIISNTLTEHFLEIGTVATVEKLDTNYKHAEVYVSATNGGGECRTQYIAECDLTLVHNTTFNKDDLKSGMLVKFSNCEIGLVYETISDGIVLESNSIIGSLNSITPQTWSDVEEVYSIPNARCVVVSGEIFYKEHLLDTSCRTLLWQREDVKEYTMDELKELIGHDFKIIEEDK